VYNRIFPIMGLLCWPRPVSRPQSLSFSSIYDAGHQDEKVLLMALSTLKGLFLSSRLTFNRYFSLISAPVYHLFGGRGLYVIPPFLETPLDQSGVNGFP